MAVSAQEMEAKVGMKPVMTVAPTTPEDEAVAAAQEGVQESFEPSNVVFEVPASPPVVEGVTASIA
ncbi:hypothetical protein HY945_03810 [Candidatus Gottesmanbacteria bacterium]|nr:hypothetical protein [Candidatus Gottesmanbacteria bacterium]